jgi:hypothetical protein
LLEQGPDHLVVAHRRRRDPIGQGQFMAHVDQEVELVAEPLHDLLDLPVGVEILLATAGRLRQSQPHLGLLTRLVPTPSGQRRGVSGRAMSQVGHHRGQPPNHRIETRPHRGQVDGVPQDVKEPREIPVMGDLLFGLDSEQSLQRGITADFGEAGVIRGMP